MQEVVIRIFIVGLSVLSCPDEGRMDGHCENDSAIEVFFPRSRGHNFAISWRQRTTPLTINDREVEFGWNAIGLVAGGPTRVETTMPRSKWPARGNQRDWRWHVDLTELPGIGTFTTGCRKENSSCLDYVQGFASITRGALETCSFVDSGEYVLEPKSSELWEMEFDDGIMKLGQVNRAVAESMVVRIVGKIDGSAIALPITISPLRGSAQARTESVPFTPCGQKKCLDIVLSNFPDSGTRSPTAPHYVDAYKLFSLSKALATETRFPQKDDDITYFESEAISTTCRKAIYSLAPHFLGLTNKSRAALLSLSIRPICPIGGG